MGKKVWHRPAFKGPEIMSERRRGGNQGAASFRSRLRLVLLRLLARRRQALGEHGWADVEKPGCPQLLDAGQVFDAVEAEMRQEGRGRDPGQGPSGGVAAAPRLYPAGLDQPVERAVRDGNAADRLD